MKLYKSVTTDTEEKLQSKSEINIKENTIGIMSVPGGAFELPLATKKLIEKTKPKVVIVVGCII